MISIVIPTYNEEKRIAASLEKLASFLKTRREEFEVIVSDEGSSDKTGEVVDGFAGKIKNLKLIKSERKPWARKGLAVNKGVLAAIGNEIVFTDADFSTPIEEIDKLLSKLNAGYDIAIGSRALDPQTVKKRQNIFRETMGRIWNFLTRIFTVRGIIDTQCGFKAYKRAAARELFESQKIFDFGFDVEILYLAQQQGLKIAEVPVLWYNDEASTVSPFRDSWNAFLDLFKIRLFHSKKNGSLLDKFFYTIFAHRTFWRFSIVGLSNTVVDYGLFFVLTSIISLPPLVSNPISVETAIIWSFIWNNLWTFSKRQTDKTIINRFFIFQFVSLGALILSQIGLLILNQFFDVYALLAKAITIPIVLIFNYLLNSRWTFRETGAGKANWYLYTVFIILLSIIYLALAL
jgi:dolichyl-phosphate beta-glucosyltransferase